MSAAWLASTLLSVSGVVGLAGILFHDDGELTVSAALFVIGIAVLRSRPASQAR